MYCEVCRDYSEGCWCKREQSCEDEDREVIRDRAVVWDERQADHLHRRLKQSTNDMEIETHPVQVNRHNHLTARCPKAVTMRAYEVYVALYGEQQALMDGDCRGGFGVNELIAFLYAASFPNVEWRPRFNEAMTGMQGI